MKYLEPESLTAFKNYNVVQFRKDLIAGIIVGVVALPLSLAFAIAAWFVSSQPLFLTYVKS